MDARLKQFALVGLSLLLVFLFLYPYLLPGYRSAVLGVSKVSLGFFHPPIRLDVQLDLSWRVVVPATQDRSGWTFVMDDEEFGHEVTFMGLAILPALVLATPVGFGRRIRLLVVALFCLFIANVLSVVTVIAIVATQCHGRETERTCGLIAGSLSSWSHITTFGLWALLTWRSWFGEPADPARDRAGRLRR